jgi:hypothetical protein
VGQSSAKNKIAIGFGFAWDEKPNAKLLPQYAQIPNDGASQYHDSFQDPPGVIDSNSVDKQAFVVNATRNDPDNAIYGHWVVQWGDPFWLHLWVLYTSAQGTLVYGLISEQPNFYLSVDDLSSRWKYSKDSASFVTSKIFPQHDPYDAYWGEYGIQYDDSGSHGVYMILHMQFVPPSVFLKAEAAGASATASHPYAVAHSSSAHVDLSHNEILNALLKESHHIVHSSNANDYLFDWKKWGVRVWGDLVKSKNQLTFSVSVAGYTIVDKKVVPLPFTLPKIEKYGFSVTITFTTNEQGLAMVATLHIPIFGDQKVSVILVHF